MLAHELAHGLFHYDRPAIFCHDADHNPIERFADRFAAYFLVPSEALSEWVGNHTAGKVAAPEEVVQLAHYFGISYKAMLRRLREMRLLDAREQTFTTDRPNILAR
jgi:Zn-dependent peptidase ImmA (M78 family)